MKTVKRFLVSACALSILVTSCQKNVITPKDQSAYLESSSLNATVDEVETTPPVYTSVVHNVNANVAGFWQAVPSKYNTTTKKYPLIIFIHGIGELGTSLGRMNCCGLPRHLYNKTFPANFNVGGVNHSFVVIAPQFKARPSAAHVQSVIDYAKSRWRVDETRVYVFGLSMGAGSTWNWAGTYGQNAAAIVPICGGTSFSTYKSISANVAKKNLPIWGLYSSADQVMPIRWARDMFTWVDAANPTFASKTKLTIWTDTDHNGTWSRGFNPNTKVDGYNVYEWALLQKRGTTSAPTPTPTPEPEPTPEQPSGNQLPIARAGADRIIPLSWNYMPTIWGNTSTDPDGKIVSYKWTKISGPSSYIIHTPTANYTKVTNLVAGAYVFRLTVTDNDGGTRTDDVSIHMTSPSYTAPATATADPAVTNQLPVARAGVNRTIPLSWNYMPTIWGNTSTDADGYIVGYKWTKISGPSSYSLRTPNASYTKVTNLVAGTYVFRLTVTDNKGGVRTDDITITMTAQ